MMFTKNELMCDVRNERPAGRNNAFRRPADCLLNGFVVRCFCCKDERGADG